MNLLLVMLVVLALASTVSARKQMPDNTIPECRVLVSEYQGAPNMATVFTVRGGEKCTVVIAVTSQDYIADLIDKAAELKSTPPTAYTSAHGTPFAIVRAYA